MFKRNTHLLILFLGLVFAENSNPDARLVNCELVDFSHIRPVEERMQNRSMPSIFAWGTIWPHPSENPRQWQIPPTEWDWEERGHVFYRYAGIVQYLDMVYSDWSPYGGVERISNQSEGGDAEHWRLIPEFYIDTDWVLDRQQQYHTQNPNFIYLSGINIHSDYLRAFPDDPKYWLYYNGNIVSYPDPNVFIVDLRNPEVQEIVIAQLVAKANCGVWDGIFIDSVAEDGYNIAGVGPLPFDIRAEYREAFIHILSEFRKQVRDNFLITINAGYSKSPGLAPYINGAYMELAKEDGTFYTLESILEIEEILFWNEENFREPRINCLEVFGLEWEAPISPNNRKWMRFFTTLSLTHSDGYVSYNLGETLPGDHDLIWHDFWDADLGRPVGQKRQLYEGREGVFIREFTNGWAVYNRSGTEQEINFSVSTTSVESNVSNKTHRLPNLDGEIYLKTTADLNGDGIVNILDLVIVANSFGKMSPDLNGDGIVNILDLVIVANNFQK